MPIGKSYMVKTTKDEIEKYLKSSLSDDSKKQVIGTMLFKLAQKYGNETANQIIDEYNLISLNIKQVKE